MADADPGTAEPAAGDGARARLTREDWIAAAFRALLAEGAGGLRVEALARGLGATKGSFYWHFRDAADLRAAVLAAWAARAAPPPAADPAPPARRRVMAFVDLWSAEPCPEAAGLAEDEALRDWARGDPAAQAALAGVDAHRLEALREAFGAAGLGAAAAARAAATLMAAAVGFRALRRSTGADTRRDLAALARALLDAGG